VVIPEDGLVVGPRGEDAFTGPLRVGVDEAVEHLQAVVAHADAVGVRKSEAELATNLPVSIVGNANPTRLSDPFETHCNIDPITKDIIVCDDNITDVNADAKFDPLVLRHIGILFAARWILSASHGVDHAGELNKSAVPGVLDDTSVMLSDFGIEKRLSESFQLRQRAFFVDPY
jgi:hypothetical protein